jgi:hypothetical protein
MNSVERIKWYAENLQTEAADEIEATAPPPEWPTAGAIELNGLVVGYRQGACATEWILCVTVCAWACVCFLCDCV